MADVTVSTTIDTFMKSADKSAMRINLNPTKFVVVESLSDLPDPVAGVITIDGGKFYLITSDLDLAGNRLNIESTVSICGTSSETSSITSTGLSAGVPMITCTASLPMRNITIKDVDTALLINSAGTGALDWSGVNFVNVPTIGTVKNVSNFIFKEGAFIGSSGLSIDEEIDTFAVEGSLVAPTTGTAISIAATAVIARRFRIIYSAFVIPSAATGISVSTSATIPTEGYILDTVNFSGSGTYTTGVTFSDDKARFSECRGVVNSANIGAYTMLDNAVVTTIAAVNTPVKIAGTTTAASITQRFTHSNNRLTETSAIIRDYKVSAKLSLTSGNNKRIGIYVAKNGTVIDETEVYFTTDGTGKSESGSVQGVVMLEQGDFVEIWIENATDSTDITVEVLNVIVEALN